MGTKPTISDIDGAGAHEFDQAHAQGMQALRKERKAFFVMIAGEGGLEAPSYTYSVNGDAQELWQWFADVAVTAQSMADTIQRASDEP